MDEVKRILGKVVGQEIPADELKLINGGLSNENCCPAGYHQTFGNQQSESCDKD